MKLRAITSIFSIGRPLVDLLKLPLFLPLIVAGCAGTTSEPSHDHWAVVETYFEDSKTHFLKGREISQSDITAEEETRLREELGPAPDIAPAITGSLAIVESKGERFLDAADFLMTRAGVPNEGQQATMDSLVEHFGPDWPLLQAYIESQDRFMEAVRTEVHDELTRGIVERGVSIPTLHAVAVARAMIETNHERAIDAADFLMQQSYAMRPGNSATMLALPWVSDGMEIGESALVDIIGPDWNIIQNHIDRSTSWRAAEQEIRGSGLDKQDEAHRLRTLGDQPKTYRATAAAVAILNTEGLHDRTREAAEFLLDNPLPGGAARALRGARAIAEHLPDYDQWPLRLKQVDGISSVNAAAKSFVAGLAESLTDRSARATARFFAASHQIESANHQNLDSDERVSHREAAEKLATGLSTGIEDELFVLTKQETDGADMPMTFADAEAELLYSLQSTMVGSLVSDVSARRLDGSEDSLADYAGRVVLVDFWATWCGPCKEAFPKLRTLVDQLPSEHFRVIGVNVDAEIETVTEYLASEPLAWTVWYVGDESELVRKWHITGYPTYVLINHKGRVLKKHAGTYDAQFRTEIEQAVHQVGAYPITFSIG